MTVTATQSNASGHARLATGTYTDSAASPAAPVLNVGFKARVVKLINMTTGVVLEYVEGMAAASAIKYDDATAKTPIAINSGGISIDATTGAITLPAPAQNDQLVWFAQA